METPPISQSLSIAPSLTFRVYRSGDIPYKMYRVVLILCIIAGVLGFVPGRVGMRLAGVQMQQAVGTTSTLVISFTISLYSPQQWDVSITKTA